VAFSAGEDPFLNGHYAAAVVKGMQQPDSRGHPLALAFLKHFDAYSKETNRHKPWCGKCPFIVGDLAFD
jgi:beta-glucosidase-like glycosyl hydrolase